MKNTLADILLHRLRAASLLSVEDTAAVIATIVHANPDLASLPATVKAVCACDSSPTPPGGAEARRRGNLSAVFAALFRQNLDNPHLARCLAACDESAVRRDMLLSYARCLAGEDVVPPPLARAPRDTPDRALRVAFVADYVSPRVTRHMACAKLGGMAVQGVFKEGPAPYTTLDQTLYDDRRSYRDSLDDIEAIIAAIKDFDADIVHLPTHLHVNETALALTCALPFPVVGDAYDLINVIFNPDAIIKHGFAKQLPLERCWFRYVDGLCMRSRVLLFADRQGMFRRGAPVIYFPETCFNAASPVRKMRESDGKLHCMVTGTMDATFGDYLSCLAPFIKGSDLVIHVVPTYFERGSRNPQVESIQRKLSPYAFFRFHHTMPHQQYLRFLGRMDALLDGIFIELPIYDRRQTGESPAAVYSMGNRICDALEQDIMIMVSPLYKDRARLAATANRAIIVRREDLLSATFWRGLQSRIEQAYRTPRALEKLSPPYQSARLERFYRSVMRRAALRRGIVR